MIVFTLEGWVATRLEGEAMEGMVCTCEFPSSVEACVSRIEMVHNIIMHPSKSPNDRWHKVIKCKVASEGMTVAEYTHVFQHLSSHECH